MKLAFYKGNGWVSRLIRFQSRGDYSHVGVLFHDGSIIEAWQDGGVLKNANIGTRHPPKTAVDIYDLPPMTEGQKRAVYRFLTSQLGKKYDWRGVWMFLMLPRIIHQDRIDSKTSWFCSDLVYTAFQQADVHLMLRAPRGRLSPVLLSYSPLLKFLRTEITK